MYREHATQLTFIFGGFFGQNVALKSLATLNRSTATNNKTLGCAFFGFHLGHTLLLKRYRGVALLELLRRQTTQPATQRLENPQGKKKSPPL
jgi:hypothetical protein